MTGTSTPRRPPLEPFYRALVEAVDDLIFVAGRDGRYLLFNERGLARFGIRAEAVVGSTPKEAFGPEHGACFERNNGRVLSSGEPLHIEERFTFQGQDCWYSTILSPVRGKDGMVEGVLGISRDIHEIKQLQLDMEERVRHRVGWERLVAELSQEALQRHDLADFFESITRRIGEKLDMSRVYLFEYDKQRNEVSNTHEWTAAGVAPTKPQMQHVPVAAQLQWAGEMFARRPIVVDDVAGIEAPALRHLLEGQGVCSVLAVPIFTFGHPYGFIGLDECRRQRHWEETDVELLRAAGRIIAQTIERHQLEKEMRLMEGLAATGRLAASIAHEINNPLQAIILHLDHIHDEADHAFREKLECVNDGFRRISTIVSRLLDVNRRVGRVEKVDLNEVLQNALALVQRQLDIRGISVATQFDAGLPMVLGDARQLHQVFLNLILNASESMEEGGRLILSTYAEEKQVVVRVKDTGCGVDAEAIPNLFEPFFSTKGYGGNGLGLFVSHAIVSEHGGKILVESDRGRGTMVDVLLPID